MTQQKSFRPKFLKLLILVFVVLQAFSMPMQRVFAASVSWTGAGDGTTWQDATNWTGAVVPTASDDVTINGGGTVTVTGNGTLNFLTLTIGGVSAGALNLTGDIGTGGTITIGNGGTLSQQNLNTQTITGTLTVQSGGTLTHAANATTQAYEVNFAAANVDVQLGGTVNADGKGYLHAEWNNPGVGPVGVVVSTFSSGAGHGGNGGGGTGQWPASGTGGAGYCDASNPTTIGSAGASGWNYGVGGDGGGLVILNASGILTLNGSITANAGTAGGGGGGSGGAVNISAGTIAGTPSSNITANGGTTTDAGEVAGGGGGCVLINYTNTTTIDQTKVTVSGGGRVSKGRGGRNLFEENRFRW